MGYAPRVTAKSGIKERIPKDMLWTQKDRDKMKKACKKYALPENMVLGKPSRKYSNPKTHWNGLFYDEIS